MFAYVSVLCACIYVCSRCACVCVFACVFVLCACVCACRRRTCVCVCVEDKEPTMQRTCQVNVVASNNTTQCVLRLGYMSCLSTKFDMDSPMDICMANQPSLSTCCYQSSFQCGRTRWMLFAVTTGSMWRSCRTTCRRRIHSARRALTDRPTPAARKVCSNICEVVVFNELHIGSVFHITRITPWISSHAYIGFISMKPHTMCTYYGMWHSTVKNAHMSVSRNVESQCIPTVLAHA